MAPKPPASLPAACTECTTTLQSAQPGSLPQKIPYKMARSGDGKLRMDYGATSVITDPKSGQMILLDHVKKEAQTIALPKGSAPQLTPPGLPMPGAPAMPTPSTPPNMSVKDLGKRMIEGHEVEGKQFTFPPVAPPKPPAVPQTPALPGTAKPPEPPESKPMVAEVWTSTQHQIPVLTRITGPFGQQMCHCRNMVAGEPHPAMFQIPAEYKQLGPPKPPVG